MVLTALMIGCMIIVCKLLSQLEDVEERRNVSQSLENPNDTQAIIPDPVDDLMREPHASHRPVVIRQSWVGNGGSWLAIYKILRYNLKLAII